jgi:DNA replication and repair protein RecF
LTLSLVVSQLEIRGFRNLTAVELPLCPRVNVLSGDNGQGKTSVLEALYFLATSRSFRTERLRDLVQEGNPATRVTATLEEAQIVRRQRAVVASARRSFFLDDKRAERLSSYAVRSPVVVFHPGDLELVHGASSGRRTLLDRVALFTDPQSGEQRSRYQQAQRERQLILERRGTAAPELEAFERVMAESGAWVHRAHAAAAQVLNEALQPLFGSVAASDLTLQASFAPGGSADADEFARQLHTRRAVDARRKGATFGPHRDDLLLDLNGKTARHHASQGQQRVLTLALKLAELQCVRAARGVEPLLLLDDVSSELDPTRTGAVYDLVQRSTSQVFVTTTRPELFNTPGLATADRRDFRLQKGALVEVA